MSAALVLRLQDILTVPGINWKYETLYVPCLVPFVIASLLCIAINRKHMQSRWYEPLAVAWRKTLGEGKPLITSDQHYLDVSSHARLEQRILPR
jgi:hypothetical protein